MRETLPHLDQIGFPAIRRGALTTLQINIGLKCNQQCVHCHVNAGPRRKEMMSPATIAAIKAFIATKSVKILDITGGAPELHPRFRELVSYARRQGLEVIDRCNLTILEEPGMAGLAEFLAANRVEITASLPCYEAGNVDRQRGNGVFAKSIRALQRLNAAGYGEDATGLILNLVFNPQGPALPPPQTELEQAYKKALKQQFKITFNRLYTLCNMPIQRFGSMLISNNQLPGYMRLLHQAHREENLENVMCRTLISVDWQGNVYDCDFNQMLGLHLNDSRRPVHISELADRALAGEAIAVRDHCYGCTAGQGSSCGGALSA